MKMISPRRTRARIAVVAVVAATMAASLAGCSTSSSADAGSGSQSKAVSLLVYDTTNPFISTMVDGAKEEASKAGIKLTVQNADNNNVTQLAQMQQAVTQHVGAILLQAYDPDGIIPGIKQAKAAGIPVISVNAPSNDGGDVLTYIGADNEVYGSKLAELAAKALPDGGNVALIQGQIGNAAEVGRTKGFKETLAKTPNLKLVASTTDNWTNDGDLSAVQDLLSKYPKGSLQAVIAEGPQLYVGAKYAHSVGRDDVKFIAGDFPVQVREAIVSGVLYGTVVQDGGEQGKLGVQAAKLLLTGKKSEIKAPTWYVDLPLVTGDNVSKYETKWNA